MVIVFDNYQIKFKVVNELVNLCNLNLLGIIFGISGSVMFVVYVVDFCVRDMIFVNDFDEVGFIMGIQGVVLMMVGDCVSFENIWVLLNYDIFYLKIFGVGIVVCVYFKNLYIEGDEDFIFGCVLVVFDYCNIYYLSFWCGVQNFGFGIVFSIDVCNDWGFFVVDSDFMVEVGMFDDSVYFGWVWDESQVDLVIYEWNMLSGIFLNGKVVICDLWMGVYIFKVVLWVFFVIVGCFFYLMDDEMFVN